MQTVPYSSKVAIVKEECVNYDQKRLATGLRNLAQKRSLNGKKGALTGNKMKLLQKYYRKAIVTNQDNIENMQREIKTAFYHSTLTDEENDHTYCSQGASS